MDVEAIEKDRAIRDLVSRYCQGVVRRDPEAWGATWARDGEWHLMGNVIKGRNAIVARWHELVDSLPFIHQLASNGLLDLTGDGATGQWFVTEYGVMSDGKGLLNLGIYHDDYLLEDGDWRFARRRFGALYMGPPEMSRKPFPFPEGF